MIDHAEAERLAKLRSYGLLDSAAEPQFDAIVGEAASRTGTPMAGIALIDGDRQWFKARLGLDRQETSLDESICAHAMRQDEVFVVPDAREDERFRDMPAVAAEGGIRFYAGAPLRTRDGTRLGTLCVIDVQRRDALDEDDRVILETLARRTVAAFELRREMRDRGLNEPEDHQVSELLWRRHAAELLAKSAVALERAGEGEALAHLEHVVTLVDESLARAD